MGIVRFKKGSTVEVLNIKEKDSSSGSWRIAKIISGNGRTYLVRYHQFISNNSMTEERVPRSAIRPCPPAMEPSKDWMAGDLVEVFEEMSWRPARVSRVLVEDRYLLELLHSSKTTITYRGFIRIWQSWQNNQWVVVQEDPRTQNVHEDICLPGGHLDYQWTQSGRATRKRKLEQPSASTEEPTTKVSSRLKVIIKLGLDKDMGAGGNMQEEKLLHDQVMPYLHDRHNDSSSPASSVGSCNIRCYACSSADDYASTSSPYLPSPGELEKIGAFGRDTPIPTKAETEATYHELELQAMRSVMKEFYDSPPVSLEQEEALLKKLRLALHISDNEFSRELRNLMSK